MATPDLNKYYTWAVQTCNAPNIGYSLDYRNGQTVGGITYYDCSSFVWFALKAGGWDNLPSYPFTTYDMIPVLLAGGWHEVPANGTILPGDIGWNLEHTEIAYAKGENGVAVFMGAHDSIYPLPDQVSIGVGGDPNIPRSFDRIFRYGSGGATGYGSSIYVVAALAGNAWVESKINPVYDETNGLGIWRWRGTRLTDLQDWFTDKGYQTDSPSAQLQYFTEEAFWSGSSGGITTFDDFMLTTSDDIELLTTAFLNCWEQSVPQYLQQRIDFAEEAYQYIEDHAQDTEITTWETEPEEGQTELSRQQALNNAVLIYRFFSAGGGGGGTPTEAKKKMPLWMLIRYFY